MKEDENMSKRSLSDRQKGMICIILSAFCFAWMNAFVRLSGDLPFIQKSFFRNLVALLFALAMLLREHGCFLPKKGISAVSGTACHGGNAGDPVQFLRDRSSGTVGRVDSE